MPWFRNTADERPEPQLGFEQTLPVQHMIETVDGQEVLHGRPPPSQEEICQMLWRELILHTQIWDGVNHPRDSSEHEYHYCWRVVPVLEPLKVRVITKGPEVAQWICHTIQKALHDHLRALPMFAALDHPLSSSDLGRYLLRVQKVHGLNHCSFVSGDYQGATDSLNMNVSKLILERILDRFVCCSRSADFMFLLRTVARTLLCSRGLLLYDTGPVGFSMGDKLLVEHLGPKDDFLRSALGFSTHMTTQENGQLMGCILSFPILCIANYAAFLLSEKRRFQAHDIQPSLRLLESQPVLINGDDIVFTVNDEVDYDRWGHAIAEFGFKKSIGKNYISDRILMINSQMYHYLPGRPNTVDGPCFATFLISILVF